MFLENQTLTDMVAEVVDVDFRIEFFHFKNCQHIFGPCVTLFTQKIYKKNDFFFFQAKQMFLAKLFKNLISQEIWNSKCHWIFRSKKKSHLWKKIDILTICTKPWVELLWYIQHNTFAYLTRVLLNRSSTPTVHNLSKTALS